MTSILVLHPQSVDFYAILPLLWIAAGIMSTLLLPFALKGKSRIFLPITTLLFLGGSFGASVKIWNEDRSSFDGMYSADNFALFAGFIFLVSAFFTVMAIAARYCPFQKSPPGEGLFGSPEVFPLILTVVAGALTMAASRNLILTFLALETLSIPLYVLAGLNLNSLRSKEASLKYFLVGAYASGFFAYGISLIYGAVGRLDYRAIFQIASPLIDDKTLIVGLSLAAVGFAFKVALVPFHTWVPDVYQGSPTLITGFMASLVKTAGFAAVIRFFGEAVVSLYYVWWIAAAVITVLTMTIGNLMALHQTSLKRLLAFSSIAHAGYLMLAVITIGHSYVSAGQSAGDGGGSGVESALFYLAGYSLSVIGAFTVIWWLTPSGKDGALLDISDVEGLSSRHPFSAALLAVFLLSLAGFPLTAGFLGKFYLFTAALREGLTVLVIIALLNTVLSAYYYLKVIVAMYMKPAAQGAPATPPVANAWIYTVVWLSILVTFWLGIIPASILDVVQSVTLGA